MRTLSGEESPITDINVTPLVDIVLVLLIIFMATAPLIHRRSVNINVPKAAHSEKVATQTLQIILDEKRMILLGGRKIKAEELGAQISALVQVDPLLHVAVLADQNVAYGEVIGLLDIIRGSGVKKVALEVRPKRK